MIVGPFRQVLDELERVLFEDFGLVVVLLDEVVELLLEVMEEDGVVVHVLQEVLPSSLLVTFELDPSALVIQVQHGVERVVVQIRLFADDVLYIAVFSELAHSLSNPEASQRRRPPSAQEFDSIHEGYLTLCCDLVGRAAIVLAEVRVSGADDSDQMAAVLFDIEEFDDLPGNSPAIATGPVGGGDENEWLIHSKRLFLLVNVGNRTAGWRSLLTKRCVYSELAEK